MQGSRSGGGRGGGGRPARAPLQAGTAHAGQRGEKAEEGSPAGRRAFVTASGSLQAAAAGCQAVSARSLWGGSSCRCALMHTLLSVNLPKPPNPGPHSPRGGGAHLGGRGAMLAPVSAPVGGGRPEVPGRASSSSATRSYCCLPAPYCRQGRGWGPAFVDETFELRVHTGSALTARPTCTNRLPTCTTSALR